MNYIKVKALQVPDQPKFLKPDDLLNKIFLKNKPSESLKFDELFSIIFAKLSPMHQIKKAYSDNKERDTGVLTRKGRFQPVEFKLESRGGNKKVTCIYYLSAFDLDSMAIQSKIKKELGCSVSINEANASATSDNYVVCVQGNQIYPVSEILKSRFNFFLLHFKTNKIKYLISR